MFDKVVRRRERGGFFKRKGRSRGRVDNEDQSEIDEDKDGRISVMCRSTCVRPLTIHDRHNAKSPDTLHPPKLIVPRSEFPSFLSHLSINRIRIL